MEKYGSKYGLDADNIVDWVDDYTGDYGYEPLSVPDYDEPNDPLQS